MLKEEGLTINDSKTEKYNISINSDTTWKKCKYLGSLLDTTEDIKRRKGLAHDSFKTLRVFKAYVESIFLYNAEIWTLTKTLEDSIDSFQRRLIRKVIRVKWPRVISNEHLYQRTQMQPWSIVITKRRLSWFGHVLRLPSETPARQALNHYIKPVKKPRKRPKTTWLPTVLTDIKKYSDIALNQNITTNINRLEILCSNRKAWKDVISSIILNKSMNVQ